MNAEPDAHPEPPSVAKRHQPMATFDDGTLHVDFTEQEVTLGGTPVDLTPIEYDLLRTPIRHRGQVLSSEQLHDLTWDDPGTLAPHRVKFFVLRLRNKLGWDEGEDQGIQAVQGGYQYPQ